MTTSNQRTLLRLGEGRAKSIGTIHEDAPTVVIRESVLEQILDYSEGDLHRELGGFLIGSPEDDPATIVRLRHFLPAVDVQSKAASLTFTHDTWRVMTRQVSEQFPAEKVVGWQHTHPGLGVFLSGYDLFIQRNFFRQPWQIAMVVDPIRCELGFFQWRGNEVVDCGFVCAVD